MTDERTYKQPQDRQEDLYSFVLRTKNWGRWGPDDQVGAPGLVTADARLDALKATVSGDVVSLSRPVPTTPAENNAFPAQQYLMRRHRADGSGVLRDYLGFDYHGHAMTHIDALSHVYDEVGMWGGRLPQDESNPWGVNWADIDQWRNGIVSRCVLLDIPALREEPYVSHGRPVTDDELWSACTRQGVDVSRGDAIAVYCGREEFERVEGPWGAGRLQRPRDGAILPKPGLDPSCLRFLHEVDASALIWDMGEAVPSRATERVTVHAAIWAYGMALIDNAVLEDAAMQCAANGRSEFVLVVAPLRAQGATGCPVNPLAIF